MPSSFAKRLAAESSRLLQGAAPKRRGPAPFCSSEQRRHSVSSRFNGHELAELDRQRQAGGDYKRGEWLRMSWLGRRPVATLPPLNRKVYIETARSAANLTQIASYLAPGPVRTDIGRIQTELAELRALILPKRIVVPVDVVDRTHEVANQEDRKLRRGPYSLPTGEARYHVVSVRLNEEERYLLEEQRGQYKQGEWLRMAWQDLPPDQIIPAVTERAYSGLSASAESLNKIAHYVHLNGSDFARQLHVINSELVAFAANLARAKANLE